MSEFINYPAQDNIHVMRYKRDQEAAKQASPCNQSSKGLPKFDQEPVLFKPLIKDILHGGSYDRVFSKTESYKGDMLRCSGGIVMPSAFLDLLSEKQRAQALELHKKGLLIVQICPAQHYFSSERSRLKTAKVQIVQSDIKRVYLPKDVAATETPMSPSSPKSDQNMQSKLFISVTQLTDHDQDCVKMPHWVFKELKMYEGQPLCISIPKWPASLHFYDAKTIEIVPTSPNYYCIVEMFHEEPRGLPLAIKEAISRYKVFTHGAQIELFIAGKILKAKLKLVDPSQQLCVINNQHQKLQINVQLTSELERIASIAVISRDKLEKDVEMLRDQGLDLNAVLKERGLDLEVMEQLENQHHQRMRELAQRTLQPHVSVMKALKELMYESPGKVKFYQTNKQKSPVAAERPVVTESIEQPHIRNVTLAKNHFVTEVQINGQECKSPVSSAGSSGLVNSTEGDQLLASSRSNLNKPKFSHRATIAQEKITGQESPITKLWQTAKIGVNNFARKKGQAIVGKMQGVSPSRKACLQNNQRASSMSRDSNKGKTRGAMKRDSSFAGKQGKTPTHQMALDKKIHLQNRNVLSMNPREGCLELTTSPKKGDRKQSFLLNQLGKKDRPSDKTFVIPALNQVNNIEQSVVTVSIDEKSSHHFAALRNQTATSAAASGVGELFSSQREEKKTQILRVVKGHLESFDAKNDMKKLSASNLHNRAQSIHNLQQKVQQDGNGKEEQRPDMKTRQNNKNLSIAVGSVLEAMEGSQVIKIAEDETPIPQTPEHPPEPNRLQQKNVKPMATTQKIEKKRNSNFNTIAQGLDILPIEVAEPIRLQTLGQEKSQRASDTVPCEQTAVFDPSSQENNTGNRVTNASRLTKDLPLKLGRLTDPSNQEQDIQTELQAYDTHDHPNHQEQELVLEQDQYEEQEQLLAQQKLKSPSGNAMIQLNQLSSTNTSQAGVTQKFSAAPINKSAVLANHKNYESNQSVFDKLPVMGAERATGNTDEYKSMLNFIDSARPDEYNKQTAQGHGLYHARRCSKNHTTNMKNNTNHIDGALYKLDHEDAEPRSRAQSSYGRKRKRSLASQLKYNDRMLLRGVTGSPLSTLAIQMNSKNYMTKRTGVTSLTTCGQTTITSRLAQKEEVKGNLVKRTSALVPNHDVTVEQQQTTKMLMLTNSGSKVISVNSIDAKSAQMSLFDKHQLNTAQSPEPVIQPQQSVTSPLYKAVKNQKFDAAFNKNGSNKRVHRRGSMPPMSLTSPNSATSKTYNVKTGQLSRLFQRYNKQICEQRVEIERQATIANFKKGGCMASRETTPYRLDRQHQTSVTADCTNVKKRSLTAKRRRYSAANRTQTQRQMKLWHFHEAEQKPISGVMLEFSKHNNGNEKITADASSTETARQGPDSMRKDGSTVMRIQTRLQTQGQTEHTQTHAGELTLNPTKVTQNSKANIATLKPTGQSFDDRTPEATQQDFEPDGLREDIIQPVEDDSIQQEKADEVLQDNLQGTQTLSSMNTKVMESLRREDTKQLFQEAGESLQLQGTELLGIVSSNLIPNMPSSSDGDIVMSSTEVPEMYVGGKAVIEINVNRVDACHIINADSDGVDSHRNFVDQPIVEPKKAASSDKEILQPKIVSLARLSPSPQPDERINHDCFPGKRIVSKRDSVISRLTNTTTSNAENSKKQQGRNALSANPRKRQKNKHDNSKPTITPNQDVYSEPRSASTGTTNLAVDKILVRKKHRKQHVVTTKDMGVRKVRQIRRRSIEIAPTETSFKADLQLESQKLLDVKDFSSINAEAWPMSAKNNNTIKIKTSPAGSSMNQPSKAASYKVKWRIVKQKVVQSPRHHIEKKRAELYGHKYRRVQQPTSLNTPGRRIKALNTLCIQQNPQPYNQVSPARGVTPIKTSLSSPKYFETTQIVLSQRSTAVTGRNASPTTTNRGEPKKH